MRVELHDASLVPAHLRPQPPPAKQPLGDSLRKALRSLSSSPGGHVRRSNSPSAYVIAGTEHVHASPGSNHCDWRDVPRTMIGLSSVGLMQSRTAHSTEAA